MKNRIIPRLEVLEDKLPPGSLSSITEFFPDHVKNPLSETSLAVRNLNVIPSVFQKTSAAVDVLPQKAVLPMQTTSNSSWRVTNSAAQDYGIELPSLQFENSLEKLGVDSSSLKPARTEYVSASSPSLANGIVPNSPGRFTGQLPSFIFQMDIQNPLELALLTAAVTQSANTLQPNADEPMLAAGIGGMPGDPGYFIDNYDGYWLELNTVTFYGDYFTEVTSDLSQAVYAPPHWVDSANHNDRDDRTENLPVGSNLPGKNMGQPVSYASGTGMEATINVDLIYIPPPPGVISDLPPQDKTVYLVGVTKYLQSGTFRTMHTDIITVGDPKEDVPNNVYVVEFQQPLMDTVYHWDNMVISWQYAYAVNPPPIVDPGWMTFNQSRNANYVTYEKPVTGMTLFLTLAYYGTLTAHGESTLAGTVQKMWEGNFKDAAGTMRAEDAEVLGYYGRWTTTNNTVPSLLASTHWAGAGDGNCQEFADLWIEFLKAHGLTGAQRMEVNALTTGEGFLVNDWTDGANAKNIIHVINGMTYEWLNRTEYAPSTFFKDPLQDKHGFNIEEVRADLAGVAGQNKGNPPSMFGMHALVEYLSMLWDPSYGKIYMNMPDFETRGITGYWTYEYNSFGAVYRIYIRNKDNDPNTAEIG